MVLLHSQTNTPPPRKKKTKKKLTVLVFSPSTSLSSAAGNFECSLSGLRWVCKEKVSFKYHFVSWEEHQERVRSLQYMPGGPLVDIVVISGKLDEVYMPHWICTGKQTQLMK